MSNETGAHDPSVASDATPPHLNGEENGVADSIGCGKTLRRFEEQVVAGNCACR
jgi:hypothetical protein